MGVSFFVCEDCGHSQVHSMVVCPECLSENITEDIESDALYDDQDYEDCINEESFI